MIELRVRFVDKVGQALRGGASALPYYEALNLQPRANAPAGPPIPMLPVPATPMDEAAMLPVRSAKLTPGTVARRVIEAPGLRPDARHRVTA